MGHAFSQTHSRYLIRRLLSYFQTQKFPLNLVLQIDAIIVLFCSFLELGILLHLTLPLITTSLHKES